MKKYDVSCSRCCGTFLETNDNFDMNEVTGDMFKVKDGFDLEFTWPKCPSCGWPICGDNGRVKRLKASCEVITPVVAVSVTKNKYPNLTRTSQTRYTSKELAKIVGCSESSIRGKRKLLDEWGKKEGRGYVYTYGAIDFLKGKSK